jgi:hypothetical protein
MPSDDDLADTPARRSGSDDRPPDQGASILLSGNRKKYGRPIGDWQDLVRQKLPAKHMELVAMLKNDHGMGHGNANALVAYTLATAKS